MKAEDVLRAQLYAMRYLLDGVTGQLERVIATLDIATSSVPLPFDADSACQHPPEKQIDATTLGGVPQIVCLLCGQQRIGSVDPQ
jgi:hypothetical protein